MSCNRSQALYCSNSAGTQSLSRLATSKAVFSLVWKLIRRAVAVGFSVLASPWDPWYGTILTKTGGLWMKQQPLRAPRAGAGNFTSGLRGKLGQEVKKPHIWRQTKGDPKTGWRKPHHRHCWPPAKTLWCWQTCRKSLFLVFWGKTEPPSCDPKEPSKGSHHSWEEEERLVNVF